ncbi:MAG: ADP-forming succinate--CoA ligase subunit beta [Bacteriovoracaceae bacterium]|nr:ADP-forming succinate--CoA ligase subunit beta [Bacteriovoracaceae bacterium]
MNVHEHQAKELMRKFGVPTLNGDIATTVSEATGVAKKLGGKNWVVKAQIHAGGRGKAGGVKLAKSLAEVKKHATEILGKTLVTHQTGSEGKEVKTILVEEGCDIKHEYYLAIVLDRSKSKLSFIASSEGGVEIEKIAKESPEKIISVTVDPATGVTPFVGRKLAYGLGMTGKVVGEAAKVFKGLYDLYVATDCTIAEINPLVTTKTGSVIALDAKLNFDDNALFRNEDVQNYRDLSEESKEESDASDFGLSYISLDGNIGCMVNGAGLAMGTMDIIKLHGGEPANFLDVGGSATQEAIEKAFSIILSDDKVEAILINIFGGIMKCDLVAAGIVGAAQHLHIKVPLVVRLEGTNVTLGKKILKESALEIIPADNLEDGAVKVIKALESKQDEEE